MDAEQCCDEVGVSPDPASCPLALCPLAMSFHAGSQEQGGSLGFSSQDGRE